MATKAPKVGKLGLAAGDVNTPLLQALEFLCQTFGYEMDSWERKAYERTLAGLSAEVLTQGAQRLVDQAAAGRKFYPVPKAPCVKVQTQLRLAAYRDSLPILCPICEHEKSYEGARFKTVIENGVERLTQCDCRTAALDAADRVGQPLALPASREDLTELERSGS